ncbi:MAG TPA: hypothetical protein VK568_08490 [Thermodesulfobacteriota bacterium]|nr:hypothetical protein [Thermodesulfobacteriota bacterium]
MILQCREAPLYLSRLDGISGALQYYPKPYGHVMGDEADSGWLGDR